MRITPTTQLPGGPADKPLVIEPVYAALDCPVQYVGGATPAPTPRIFCSWKFAETVLAALEAWAVKYHFALCHLGAYNPRKARHMDGSPILPVRWSNHAYGAALDWQGIIDADGHHLTIAQLQDGAPAKYAELLEALNNAIRDAGKRPEIVNEGGAWLHVGYYH